MSESLIHRYVFSVSRPPRPIAGKPASTVDASTNASSPSTAEAQILAIHPHGSRVTLLRIEPAGEGCGDERCSVCYPSSRNRGQL